MAESDLALGAKGRVKVIISKRQDAANKKKERLKELFAKLSEGPPTRENDRIMDEIWRSREPKPLAQDQLPTKNDVLLHENFLVRHGLMQPRASMTSRPKQ